jgi:geranylgeranyl diphosphate synthase type II
MPNARMLEALNAEISSLRYGEQPPELYDPIRYLMALGGKRMRPLLTLLSSSMFTPDWQPFVRPALAVEVFHNFTLMHDDIMDAAPLRRGQPTGARQMEPQRSHSLGRRDAGVRLRPALRHS